MKEKILLGIFCLVVLTFVFYTGGVIIGQSFNPWNWDEDTRICIASFWVMCFLIACVVIPQLNENN